MQSTTYAEEAQTLSVEASGLEGIVIKEIILEAGLPAAARFERAPRVPSSPADLVSAQRP